MILCCLLDISREFVFRINVIMSIVMIIFIVVVIIADSLVLTKSILQYLEWHFNLKVAYYLDVGPTLLTSKA